MSQVRRVHLPVSAISEESKQAGRTWREKNAAEEEAANAILGLHSTSGAALTRSRTSTVSSNQAVKGNARHKRKASPKAKAAGRSRAGRRGAAADIDPSKGFPISNATARYLVDNGMCIERPAASWSQSTRTTQLSSSQTTPTDHGAASRIQAFNATGQNVAISSSATGFERSALLRTTPPRSSPPALLPVCASTLNSRTA